MICLGAAAALEDRHARFALADDPVVDQRVLLLAGDAEQRMPSGGTPSREVQLPMWGT
jgi:hypothetical protein